MSSKFMTVNGVTFKKTDLKRIEKISMSKSAYLFVSGMKHPIMMTSTSSENMNELIIVTITEAEEK